VRVAVLAVDPSRRRGGGALLGDRIRMNAIEGASVFFRSVATRGSVSEIPSYLPLMVLACKAAGFDLVVVETPGIGQGDTAIADLADVSLYVMTPEFGAASQLEKIDMLDFADVVAINKFERRGAADALRDVRRQVARNRELFAADPESLPVFGTVAARFNDDGVTALYLHLRDVLAASGLPVVEGRLGPMATRVSTALSVLVPPARARYLAEIAESVRAYHARTQEQAAAVQAVDHLRWAHGHLVEAGRSADDVAELLAHAERSVDPSTSELLDRYEADRQALGGPTRPTRPSLSGTPVPQVALPRPGDCSSLLSFLRAENLPGRFPFTGGVFPTKRIDEDPIRMFAGEGGPARTNLRFHLLAADHPASRLSTAFDSVTLYGADPDERPDIYGKVGNSGVSIATLADMELLYDGFDLCDPSTSMSMSMSMSMSINGPAPAILAMFLNVAIDQRSARLEDELGRPPTEEEGVRGAGVGARQRAGHRAGRHLEGGPGSEHLHPLDRVRPADDGRHPGVVRLEPGAPLLLRVGLRLPHRRGRSQPHQPARVHAGQRVHLRGGLPRPGHGDRRLRPQPQLLLLQRHGPGVHRPRPRGPAHLGDRHARQVRGGRAQPAAEYHIQTSGRSLHAQEMAFNDIRTTLQALCAISDNANSLHTNAYDEAVTTPTSESVRRAVAIQLIINREWGLSMNDNPLQGSFVIEELTELVEGAVLAMHHLRRPRPPSTGPAAPAGAACRW